MISKEYLSQLYYLDKMIEAKCQQISQLKNLATRVTPFIREDKVIGGRNENKLESYVCKWVDLERELLSDVDKILALKQNIQKRIDEIEDPRYKLVLTLRYVNCKKWDDIAKELNYTYRQLSRIHFHALQTLDLPKS